MWQNANLNNTYVKSIVYLRQPNVKGRVRYINKETGKVTWNWQGKKVISHITQLHVWKGRIKRSYGF